MEKSKSEGESPLLAATQLTNLSCILIIVFRIPLYLPLLFVSQLKKLEEVILSRRHQFRV